MALIYVVEDDKNIQEIETFALSNVGYRVEGFGSAGEFYEALNKEIQVVAGSVSQCIKENASKEQSQEEYDSLFLP